MGNQRPYHTAYKPLVVRPECSVMSNDVVLVDCIISVSCTILVWTYQDFSVDLTPRDLSNKICLSELSEHTHTPTHRSRIYM